MKYCFLYPPLSIVLLLLVNTNRIVGGKTLCEDVLNLVSGIVYDD
jgi:hypothetical protein